MHMVIICSKNPTSITKKMEHCYKQLSTNFREKFGYFIFIISNNCKSIYISLQSFFNPVFHFLVFIVRPFWLNLSYILVSSLFGFLALKASSSTPRTSNSSVSYKHVGDLDLFFTSVSAITASSMSTVEMEQFSNSQLVILTVLMLLGGQVFISMIGLQFRTAQFPKLDHHHHQNNQLQVNYSDHSSALELPELVVLPTPDQVATTDIVLQSTSLVLVPDQSIHLDIEDVVENQADHKPYLPSSTGTAPADQLIKYKAIKSLSYLVFGYLLITHIIGTSLLSIYITLIPSSYNVLKSKSLQTQTFSVFLTVSSFANCGFVPTNENLMVFKQNSGLLLILMPIIILGNALYAPCLRLVIWVLRKVTRKEEYEYLLKVDGKELGFEHLMGGTESWFLVISGVGFVLVQFVMFVVLEWGKEGVWGDGGKGVGSKLVGFVFQSINTRHSGESVLDLSIVSPAILVLIVIMMYLPPYTLFIPVGRREEVSTNTKTKGILERPTAGKNENNKKNDLIENLLFSQLGYIAIFTILICITERDKLKEDPLNFSVFNIIVEVVSAYGNVGYSTCYSCKLRLNQNEACEDKWFGFTGRWSNTGKFIIIVVMILGRLKKFNKHGGKAWELS
uniref:High-affinity potassium transporter n=1 Tax=Reaumuria trigyna TaxID=1091135 RepID=A0A2Z5WR85_9CARY|nr:high-affinity potassium transporter [Reaumuria trigyna]